MENFFFVQCNSHGPFKPFLRWLKMLRALNLMVSELIKLLRTTKDINFLDKRHGLALVDGLWPCL